SVQWPYPPGAKDHGTPRLFTDLQFPTPSKKARFQAPADEVRSELPDDEYPLVLTTGRIRDQWHTMTKTGKVGKLRQHIPQSTLQLHPDDARAQNIVQNDIILVQSRRGEVRVPVQITESIRKGTAFLPMHWGRVAGSDLNRANNLTNNLV